MVTLEELLDWTKAEAEDSELLESLLEAAIAHVENETGMRYTAAGEVIEAVTFAGWPIALPATPDLEQDFTLERWNGEAWEVVESTAYYVEGAFVRPAGSWTMTGAQTPRFRATYTAGYTAGLQPAPVRLAVKMLVMDWWANRGDGNHGSYSNDVEQRVSRLLSGYRRVVV